MDESFADKMSGTSITLDTHQAADIVVPLTQ
jgi:hypothetical protein